jgi:hypothetical protein
MDDYKPMVRIGAGLAAIAFIGYYVYLGVLFGAIALFAELLWNLIRRKG